MAPTINDASIRQIVKLEVQQALEMQLNNFHDLLLGAMPRITCLEREITDLKMHSAIPRFYKLTTMATMVGGPKGVTALRCIFKGEGK